MYEMSIKIKENENWNQTKSILNEQLQSKNLELTKRMSLQLNSIEDQKTKIN